MITTLSEIARAATKAYKYVKGDGVDNNGRSPLNENEFAISGNIVELMDEFIIEPLILVSEDLKRSDKVEDVIKLQTEMFVTYITTGFDIMLNVYKIPAKKVIAAMTNKSLDVSQIARFGYESLGDSIQTPLPLFDTESDTTASVVQNMEVKEIKYITENGKEIRFKVMIRPTLEYVNSNSLVKLLTAGITDESFFNRLDKYQAGLIDKSAFFFNTDLMEQYKKNRLNDENDIVRIINERKMAADASRVKNGVPNMSEYYQMLIISSTVSKEVELELGKKLIKGNTSTRVMKYSRSLTLTTMDDVHERCVIFVNGKKGHTDISYKGLSKTKSNSELTEVLKFLLNK